MPSRLNIVHSPHGIDHPYEPSFEERRPRDPSGGDMVALGFLKRAEGLYANTAETDLFLDRNKPSYVGGLLEMANARLYSSWGQLTEGLRTGRPQNESKESKDTFDVLYSDPARLRLFLSGMTGISMGAAMALAQQFPWQQYRTFLDIGAAQGCVPGELHCHECRL